MIDPYTMERLNAEHLKDLDREAAGLHFSLLARHNRRRALRGVWRRCVSLLSIGAKRIRHSAGQSAGLAGKPAPGDQ